MTRLISRAEFARRAGVSRAAITLASSGALAPACQADRIDFEHPAAQAYIAARTGARKPAAPPTARPNVPKRRAAAPTKKAAPAQKAPADRPRPRPDQADPAPSYLDDVKHLTIEELVTQFGTERRFKDWLDALKKIEDIREKRLSNEETDGRLISRELVKTHVFGAIDAGNRRLLGDAPKTIARRLYAMAHSQAPIEEAERTVRELISSQLKPVKTTAARVLRNSA